MEGFIYLHRQILDSEVFASQKMLKIWLWCLLKANFKDRVIPWKVGKGETTIKVKRGEFIFGRFTAEDELFIDGSTIYKIIKKLELLEMISINSNRQYSVITINNYDKYQDKINSKVASKEQPSNNQVTTKEQPSNTDNNVNKVKNVKKEIYRQFDNLSISLEDHNKLLENYKEQTVNDIYDSIENYKKNDTYKSLYLTSLKWLKKEHGKQNKEPILLMP